MNKYLEDINNLIYETRETTEWDAIQKEEAVDKLISLGALVIVSMTDEEREELFKEQTKILREKGFISLNEVLFNAGMSSKPWVENDEDFTTIDFGIGDNSNVEDFLNGNSDYIILNFNTKSCPWDCN